MQQRYAAFWGYIWTWFIKWERIRIKSKTIRIPRRICIKKDKMKNWMWCFFYLRVLDIHLSVTLAIASQDRSRYWQVWPPPASQAEWPTSVLVNRGTRVHQPLLEDRSLALKFCTMLFWKRYKYLPIFLHSHITIILNDCTIFHREDRW